jgi:hypothetical protein
LTNDATGSDRLLERRDLLSAELGQRLVGADEQEAAGRLNSDMATVEPDDSPQHSAVERCRPGEVGGIRIFKTG